MVLLMRRHKKTSLTDYDGPYLRADEFLNRRCIMKITKVMYMTVAVVFVCFFSGNAKAAVTFDFERGDDGWEVPDWALEQPDCGGMFAEIAFGGSAEKQRALKVTCDFPGNAWTTAVVEYRQEMDLEGYKSISSDIFIPESAKGGVYLARIILIAGKSWWWIEMKNPVVLKIGEWTKIEAKLDVNFVNENFFWTRQEGPASGIIANAGNVKKIIIRIESEGGGGLFGGAQYQGAVFIDNIVIE